MVIGKRECLRPRTGRRVLGILLVACALAGSANALATSARAAVRVEYRGGRIYGLFMFATTIAEVPSRPRALADVFRGSAYDTPEARERIAEFRELHRALQDGVDFEGYPANRPNGTTLEQLFIWRTLEAQNLDELRRSTQGLLPLATQNRFFELLAAFEPIYDALIWNPNTAKFEEYLGRFRATVPESRLDEMFDAAALFYGAQWPEGLPFTVAVYPIPGGRGNTSAESAGSLETVAVLLDEKDLPGRFAVMFHEMCHSLYASQPAAFQREFESYFENPSDPYAAVAYSLINEALATAVGNGWAFEQATGSRDENPWYSDPAIDGFAKAIHPLVTEYLAAGRTIDRPFVERSIALFRAKFPDAPYRFDTLFRQIVIFADGETVRSVELRDALRTGFRISSIDSFEPIDGGEALHSFEDLHSPLIIGVGAKRLDQLAALDALLPGFADVRSRLAAEGQDVLYVGMSNGRVVIVGKLADGRSIVRVVEELRRLGRIDPSAPAWIVIG